MEVKREALEQRGGHYMHRLVGRPQENEYKLTLVFRGAHSALRAGSSTSMPCLGASPLPACFVRTPFDPLSLVMDHSICRVPDAPHGHLMLTVRTDQRVPSRALRIALPIGQAGNDLDRALDH